MPRLVTQDVAAEAVAVALEELFLRAVVPVRVDADGVRPAFARELLRRLHEVVGHARAAPIGCNGVAVQHGGMITAFLTAGCFDTVTVMIQREAAHRLCARPGTADYGLLTVLTAWYAELELLFDVPPHCFVPAPKVTSTVVRLRMRSAPPADVQDEALLFAIVRAAFSQRRKTLINALAAGVPGCDKARAAAAVAACGFDARVRGETLDPAQFAALSNALRAELG